MSETANRIIKNTGFLYAKMGFTMFLSLLTMRIVLNALGVNDFGIYSVIGGAIGFLGFLDLSMTIVTQRFISYNEGAGDCYKKKQIFNISLIVHFFVALILCLLFIFAGFVFFNNVLNIPEGRMHAAKIVYVCFIFSSMLSTFTVPYTAVITAHENMKFFSLVGATVSVLKLLIAILLKYSDFDNLILYSLLMLSVPIFSLFIQYVFCIKNYAECRINLKKYWNFPLMKQMLTFAGWNISSSVAACISNQGRSVVGNFFYGVTMNTALAIAIQIDVYLKTFAINMLKAVEPVIVKKAGSGKYDQTIELTLTTSKMSFYIFSIFVVPCFIETPYILELWLDNVPEWAVVFCRFQLITSLFDQIGATFDTAIYAHGKIKKFSLYESVFYITSIVLIYILFSLGSPPYLMYIPVILFNVICYRILGFILLKEYYFLKFSTYFKKVLSPCVVVFFTTILISFFVLVFPQSFIRLLLTFLISFSIYLFLIYKRGLDFKEKSLLIEYVSNVRIKVFGR